MSITSEEFTAALKAALAVYVKSQKGKKTNAKNALSIALGLRHSRTIYKWLKKETLPHEADRLYPILKNIIGGNGAAQELKVIESPQVVVSEFAPAPTYSVSQTNLIIPILPNIPYKGLDHLVKEDQRGEVSIPRWLIGGSSPDYYALELKGPSMDSQAGDLAIIKRPAELSPKDYVVVGESHGYSFMRLADLVANKDRFTISGVVTAIFHKFR